VEYYLGKHAQKHHKTEHIKTAEESRLWRSVSGRMWYNHLSEYLVKARYTNNLICPCVFIKKSVKDLLFWWYMLMI